MVLAQLVSALYLSCTFLIRSTYIFVENFIQRYTRTRRIKMTTIKQHHHTPWFLWPFKALWVLLTTIVEMVGRFVAIVLGLVLMLAGFLVSLTVIGAIIGIPLFIIGALLTLKGIF